jgi:hypothetical protein
VDFDVEITVRRRNLVPELGDALPARTLRNRRYEQGGVGLLGNGGLNQHRLDGWDVRRIASQLFKTRVIRLVGDHLGVWPELVSVYAEAANAGADGDDRLGIVWPQRADPLPAVIPSNHRIASSGLSEVNQREGQGDGEPFTKRHD